jgi:hypothetical protein
MAAVPVRLLDQHPDHIRSIAAEVRQLAAGVHDAVLVEHLFDAVAALEAAAAQAEQQPGA